jgi:hypothetical protein
VHLVVELKAPKVKIDRDEVNQIEDYARSVLKDERFRNVNTKWVFWAISDDYGEAAAFRMQQGADNAQQTTSNGGKILEGPNFSIWVKTWSQVLEENRGRLQFFKERLEYEADKGAALEHLKDRYAQFLKGVLVEEDPKPEDTPVDDAATSGAGVAVAATCAPAPIIYDGGIYDGGIVGAAEDAVCYCSGCIDDCQQCDGRLPIVYSGCPPTWSSSGGSSGIPFVADATDLDAQGADVSLDAPGESDAASGGASE